MWKGCSCNNRETPHWNISFSVFILNVYQYNFKRKQHNVTRSNMIWKSISVFLVSVITLFIFPSSGKKIIGRKVFWNLLRKSPGLYSLLLYLSRRKKKVLLKPPWERRHFVSEGNPERFASKHSHRSIFYGVSSLSRRLSAQC